MNVIAGFIDLFLHLNKYLPDYVAQYGPWVYAALFFVIFIETGLVVTPFLPGDSLIFAAATIAAAGGLNTPLLLILLYSAAILGNMLNYQIGHLLRERVRRRQKIPLVKWEHIDRTQAFFDRHGGKTIVITRFIPIIRTFTPFVAGVGEMPYRRFFAWNIAGGVLWVTSMYLIGYFFGKVPFVEKNYSFVVVGIIVISLLPAVIAYIKSRVSGKKHTPRPEREID